MPDEATDPVVILYTNWRGETAVRRIVPGSPDPALVSQWFGSSEWHPEPQWLFSAYDLDKGAYRDFARSGVKAWGQEAVDAALSAPPAAQDGWRDIATVPEGVEVIVRGGKSVFGDAQRGSSITVVDDRADLYRPDGSLRPSSPTMWHPAPSPPST